MTGGPASLKVAIVGCGAITEQSYLPACAALQGATVRSLVDIDTARARTLAQRYGIRHSAASIDDLPPEIDIAVVALPHHLHRPVACALMDRRIHVFCEKPLACTPEDATAMTAAAVRNGVRLGVGNIRRLYWSARRVKDLLTERRLGRVVHVRCDEGIVYDWPTVSGFFFDRARAGGGVLMDAGAHVLDLLLWWLDEYPSAIEYHDDNFGGVEAECLAQLQFPSGARAELRLSRLAKLRNSYIISGEQGEVVVNPFDMNGIVLRIGHEPQQVLTGPERSFADYFRAMLSDFLRSVADGAAPAVDAASVVPSIRAIAQCYANASRLEGPWLR